MSKILGVNRSDILSIATLTQIAPILLEIARTGGDGFTEEFLCDLQDAGWIYHNNRLTERGRKAVNEFKRRTGAVTSA